MKYFLRFSWFFYVLDASVLLIQRVLHLIQLICSILCIPYYFAFVHAICLLVSVISHLPLMGDWSFLVFETRVSPNPFPMMEWVRALLVVFVDLFENLSWKIHLLELGFFPLKPFYYRDRFEIGEGFKNCLLIKYRCTSWDKAQSLHWAWITLCLSVNPLGA